MLAAPAVAAASQGGKDPTQLIAFFAQEMQLFFKHIQDSVTKYSETGEMPPSLFRCATAPCVAPPPMPLRAAEGRVRAHTSSLTPPAVCPARSRLGLVPCWSNQQAQKLVQTTRRSIRRSLGGSVPPPPVQQEGAQGGG